MRKLHGLKQSDAREEVLKEAYLDWFEIDYQEERIYAGDNIRGVLGVEDDCMSLSEAAEMLAEDGLQQLNKYRELLKNGTVRQLVLRLDEKRWTNRGVEIVTSAVSEEEGLVQGYLRVANHRERVRLSKENKVTEEESERKRMAFLSDMSHELRTPINAIVGFSRLLAQECSVEIRNEYLQIIEENNETLLQLIGDILDLSKIESGSLEVVLAEFDLSKCLNEVYASAKMRNKNHDVRLLLDIPAGEMNFYSDKHRLQQVLNNYINNAFKFTERGSVTIGCEDRGDSYYFYIRDTGCGIAADSLKQVFSRFVRLDKSVTGNGLGLSICSSIARLLEGEVGVESVEGKGSTFWCRLPKREPAQTETCEDAKKEDNPVAQIEEQPKLVLIAEDDASNYKLCEVMLRKRFRLLHAWNGKEAVQMFKDNTPDIILMDINMPEMNGYEATDAIRKLSWTVPIIATTAYALADDEARIMQSGFDAYLSKPLDLDELLKKMSSFNEQK